METKNVTYVLETKNLSIGYTSKKGETCVASHINIRLTQGHLVGLVGTNGIGKSTLLKTLTQVHKPLSGTVILNDKALHSYSKLDLAKTMSLVLTEALASKNLTVFELVALGRQPYTNWLGNLSATDVEKTNTALEHLNISHLKHRRCFELSDGQLQNVMIARALAQDTAIIVLDEPTTHLDLHRKAIVLKHLKQLCTSTQKTILFSSHDIDLAIQLCDTIIVMSPNGVITDTPCNLITKGVFNTLFPEDLIQFDANSGSFKVQ